MLTGEIIWEVGQGVGLIATGAVLFRYRQLFRNHKDTWLGVNEKIVDLKDDLDRRLQGHADSIITVNAKIEGYLNEPGKDDTTH